jgi:tetrahydromethanopterin S-methyltransferase subunit A
LNIREAIAAINQMQSDGVIERYAIGGAVGATFYLEPIATLDVGTFERQFLSDAP